MITTIGQTNGGFFQDTTPSDLLIRQIPHLSHFMGSYRRLSKIEEATGAGSLNVTKLGNATNNSDPSQAEPINLIVLDDQQQDQFSPEIWYKPDSNMFAQSRDRYSNLELAENDHIVGFADQHPDQLTPTSSPFQSILSQASLVKRDTSREIRVSSGNYSSLSQYISSAAVGDVNFVLDPEIVSATTHLPQTISSTMSSLSYNSTIGVGTVTHNGLVRINATDTFLLTTESRSFGLPLEIQILMWFLYGTLAFTAIASNMIVCYIVLSNQRMRTATNYFIVNLAVGDILMAALCIPFTFPVNLIFQYWPFGSLLCVIVSYSQANSVFISAYTMVAISIDKYLAIMYPMRLKMPKIQAKIIILVIWSLALVTSLPTALVSSLTPKPPESYTAQQNTPTSEHISTASSLQASTQSSNILSTLMDGLSSTPSYRTSATMSTDKLSTTAMPITTTISSIFSDDSKSDQTSNQQPEQRRYYCQERWNFWPKGRYYYSMALLILQFVLPLFVLVITYTRIVIVVWGKRMPGEEDNARDARMARSKRKMIKMVIFCVIAFALTWLPFNALMVIGDIYLDIWEHQNIMYIWFITHYLAMCHTITNPLIYIWMNNRFRAGFKQVIGDLCKATHRLLVYLCCYCLCLGCLFKCSKKKYARYMMEINRKRPRRQLATSGSGQIATGGHLPNVGYRDVGGVTSTCVGGFLNSHAAIAGATTTTTQSATVPNNTRSRPGYVEINKEGVSREASDPRMSSFSVTMERNTPTASSLPIENRQVQSLRWLGESSARAKEEQPNRGESSESGVTGSSVAIGGQGHNRLKLQPIARGQMRSGEETTFYSEENPLGRTKQVTNVDLTPSPLTTLVAQIDNANQVSGTSKCLAKPALLFRHTKSPETNKESHSTDQSDSRRRKKRQTHSIGLRFTSSQYYRQPETNEPTIKAELRNTGARGKESLDSCQKAGDCIVRKSSVRCPTCRDETNSKSAAVTVDRCGGKYFVEMRQFSQSTATLSLQTDYTSLGVSALSSLGAVDNGPAVDSMNNGNSTSLSSHSGALGESNSNALFGSPSTPASNLTGLSNEDTGGANFRTLNSDTCHARDQIVAPINDEDINDSLVKLDGISRWQEECLSRADFGGSVGVMTVGTSGLANQSISLNANLHQLVECHSNGPGNKRQSEVREEDPHSGLNADSSRQTLGSNGASSSSGRQLPNRGFSRDRTNSVDLSQDYQDFCQAHRKCAQIEAQTREMSHQQTDDDVCDTFPSFNSSTNHLALRSKANGKLTKSVTGATKLMGQDVRLIKSNGSLALLGEPVNFVAANESFQSELSSDSSLLSERNRRYSNSADDDLDAEYGDEVSRVRDQNQNRNDRPSNYIKLKTFVEKRRNLPSAQSRKIQLLHRLFRSTGDDLSERVTNIKSKLLPNGCDQQTLDETIDNVDLNRISRQNGDKRRGKMSDKCSSSSLSVDLSLYLNRQEDLEQNGPTGQRVKPPMTSETHCIPLESSDVGPIWSDDGNRMPYSLRGFSYSRNCASSSVGWCESRKLEALPRHMLIEQRDGVSPAEFRVENDVLDGNTRPNFSVTRRPAARDSGNRLSAAGLADSDRQIMAESRFQRQDKSIISPSRFDKIESVSSDSSQLPFSMPTKNSHSTDTDHRSSSSALAITTTGRPLTSTECITRNLKTLTWGHMNGELNALFKSVEVLLPEEISSLSPDSFNSSGHPIGKDATSQIDCQSESNGEIKSDCYWPSEECHLDESLSEDKGIRFSTLSVAMVRKSPTVYLLDKSQLVAESNSAAAPSGVRDLSESAAGSTRTAQIHEPSVCCVTGSDWPY